MKKIILIVLHLIAGNTFAQNIPDLPKGFIEIKEGDRETVNYISEGKDHVYFIMPEDPLLQIRHVPKKALKGFSAPDLLDVKFQRNSSGRIEYSGVVEVPGLSKKEIFQMARVWFADYYVSSDEVLYVSSDEVLEHSDEETGILIGTGYKEIINLGLLFSGGPIQFYSTVKIRIKEGRYKFWISEFRYFHPGTLKIPSIIPLEASEIEDPIFNMFKKAKKDIVNGIIEMYYSLQSFTHKLAKEDEW